MQFFLSMAWHLFYSLNLFIFCFFKKCFIYLFMRDTEREAESQAEGEAGSLWGAWCRTRSQDPRIMSWVKGKCSTTEPPRCPMYTLFLSIYHHLPISKIVTDKTNMFHQKSVLWLLLQGWGWQKEHAEGFESADKFYFFSFFFLFFFFFFYFF